MTLDHDHADQDCDGEGREHPAPHRVPARGWLRRLALT
jgi:hypothetical protein